MNRVILAFVLHLIAAGGAPQSQRPREGATTMKGSHVHLGVRNLGAALQWLENVWQLKPTFQSERLATLPFGPLTLILDVSENDTVATIGYESADCDADFRVIEARGAVVLEKPTDRPWGARSAYIQGPGALKFEIEQVLPRR